MAVAGKGFSIASLKSYRKFYLNFQDLQVFQTLPVEFKKAIAAKGQALPALFESEEIRQALPTQLSWSHYECLMRVSALEARTWYMQEAASQQWDYRTLKRNIASQYYYRLMQTPKAKKATVVKEMKKLTADYQKERSEFIKNPLIAEFLGVNQGAAVTESTLENAILNQKDRRR